jgi:hypothetical protein
MKTNTRILRVLIFALFGFAQASPADCPDMAMKTLAQIAIAATPAEEAKDIVVEFSTDKAIVANGVILAGQVNCGHAGQFLGGSFVNSAGRVEKAGWVFSHKNPQVPRLPVAESSILETPTPMAEKARVTGESKIENGAKVYLSGEDVEPGSPYTSMNGRLILPKSFVARNFKNGIPELQGVAVEFFFDAKTRKVTSGAVLVHTAGDNCGFLVRF